MARLKDKVQNALDEARLLVLGAQVLLGFEYRSVFESGFDVLPSHSKYLKLVGLGLLLVAFALLTWPGAYHRIVAGGEDNDLLALSYGLWFGLTCYWRRPNERLGLRTNENDSRHPAIDQAIHN